MPRKLLVAFVTLLTVSFGAAASELAGAWGAQVDGTAYDLIFDEEGGLSVIEDNEAVVVAEYEAGDGELTINDLGGAKACEADQAEGTYSYTLEGGALSLALVDDGCAYRSSMLDGTTFQAK